MQRFVQSEVLFRRALNEALPEAMRCALCYGKPSAASSARAKERYLYLEHFAAQHFAGLSRGPHRCLEVTAPAFPALALVEKVSKEFSWEKYADPGVIFSV